MSWRTNNTRIRTGIDGIMWIPAGPSSDTSCVLQPCQCVNGDTGPVGYNGLVGATGPLGESTGPTGPRGDVGFPGQQGPTGLNGGIGVPGKIGPTGPTGIAGTPGLVGQTGLSGQVGPSGVGFANITGPLLGPTGGGNFNTAVGPTGAWTLPANTFLLTLEIGGAPGLGLQSGVGSPGGLGGNVFSTFTNPANGTIYNYYLGSAGGGGVGGVGDGGQSGFAGGDLAAIYIGPTEIMIAGGGGGAGGWYTDGGFGGVGCTGSTSAGGFGGTGNFAGLGGDGGGGGNNGIGGAGGGSSVFPGFPGISVSGGTGGGGIGAFSGGGGGGNGYGGGGGGGSTVDIVNSGGGGGGAGGSYSIDPGAVFSTSLSPIAYFSSTWVYYTDPVLQYNIAGNFVYYDTSTTAKTFVIQHPLQTNKYLVHACLEGPEAGVYYRGEAGIDKGKGKGKGKGDNVQHNYAEICLADYVEHLATEFTVIVTIANNKTEIIFPSLMATRVSKGKFRVYSDIVPCEFNYLVFGKRQSIETEPEKALSTLKGSMCSPYKYFL